MRAHDAIRLRLRLYLLGGLLVGGPWLAMGCGSTSAAPSSAADATSESAAESGAWAERLVAGPGSGPALFLGPDEDASAVGYVSPGVTVKLKGGPTEGRTPVVIEGPLKVRGYFPNERLFARVQRRGRVPNTPTYVGPNDLVRVLGPEKDGKIPVSVQPMLGSSAAAAGASVGPFEGAVPAAVLGAAPVPAGAAQAPTPGKTATLVAGQDVTVHAQPDGASVAVVPMSAAPVPAIVLRERGPWFGVRIGTGPYLIGYVRAESVQLDPSATVPPTNTRAPLLAPGAIPVRLETDSERPLWRIKAGTKVSFRGKTIGLVVTSAYGREMKRHADKNEVDAFVAADDEVAVRGMVPLASLETLSGAAPAAQPSSAQPSSAQPSSAQPSAAPAPAPQPAPTAAPAGTSGAAAPLAPAPPK